MYYMEWQVVRSINMDIEFLKYLCSKPKLQNTKLEFNDKSDFRIVVEIYLSDFSNRLHYPEDYLSNIVKPYFNQALNHYMSLINDNSYKTKRNSDCV